METQEEELNRFLVEVFNEILKTEESCIGDSGFEDLSLRELHVIEAVCNAESRTDGNRAAAIAAELRVTPGTLTTAVSILEKKGYLLRIRDERDRRVVRICSTELGKEANRNHARFHAEMVRAILSAISEEEAAVFIRALSKIRVFFESKYRDGITDN